MHCEDQFGFPIYFGGEGVLAAVVLGTLPGVIAITATPAREHPWRALPILALASAVGFGLFVALMLSLPHIGDNPVLTLLLLLLIPSATGMLTAFNIHRIPKWPEAARG